VYLKQTLDRLPEGTVAVGGGLVVNGLAAYTFITLASRDLGAEAYTPVGLLWALSFLLGPGFFQPLEQETARFIAGRPAAGLRAVVRPAAILGGSLALGLAVVAVVAAPWIVDNLFAGHDVLLIGLLLVLVGLGTGHLVRGVLAGLGRFGNYSRYFIGDGLGRLLLVGVGSLVLTDEVAVYGLAVGGAPFLGVAAALTGRRSMPGRPGAPSDEAAAPSAAPTAAPTAIAAATVVIGRRSELRTLAPAMGFLLLASVSTAIVLNVSPLAVELLAGPTEREEAGRFLNALLVARVPLFFFQAVQASLLPKLSSLAADGHIEEFRRVLGRLLALVGALGAAAVLVYALVGHLAVEMAFGVEFAVGRRDMVLLATSSAVLMIVLSLAQALIAQRCQGRMALAWLAGLCTFPIVLAFGGDLFLRVELALLATVVTAMVAMVVLLGRRPGLLH
jgi:O-antigen/teichoic acid export membrane protein